METGQERGTVLIVDDDAAVVTVTRYMLESLGYEVLTARDAESALAVFEAHQKTISLVMLDMVMPRLGGKEVWEGLRRIDPDVFVLMVSGYNPGEQVEQILAQGAGDFLQKPFDITELSIKIGQLLALRKSRVPCG